MCSIQDRQEPDDAIVKMPNQDAPMLKRFAWMPIWLHREAG
ncbi:MAG: hypothetical protein N0C89_11670 [Candidatus Thiodiazotropha endolucinida]|nr:hypothetical protein [Candidatus Thiodiazotropha endolucinida]MCW4248791.1 hypothetical protein [Candidatus Thiodiazotropha endolucinida]MCW4264607.1 hypothetical protein [Candidatus Thiodiazotropha endolucinida]MCW4288397.1 hypothetical protein [Candidatus Thiodiazotropha endolucinida]MCW4295905.1 hypothetical protein [Candidatus Thiodiazotropha endolucinida]